MGDEAGSGPVPQPPETIFMCYIIHSSVATIENKNYLWQTVRHAAEAAPEAEGKDFDPIDYS